MIGNLKMTIFFQQIVKLIIVSSCLMTAISVQAQISTDGTLGPAQNLSGPDYQIGADLGQQHGSNLFHSFQEFNLQRLESATFSGPNSIQNVISRVTGGNPSNIDGTIRSLIPNADFYFLNPFGIIFGPNARLDVQGSFHASTADYLSFSNGGIFHARNPSESLLTVAPIEAFGFLDSPAPISVNGSELSVNEGNTLSLIGGDLQLQGDSSPVYELDEFGTIILTSIGSKLSANSGQIHLVSLASPGEVTMKKIGFNFSAGTKPGSITARNVQISTTGEGGGAIYIRGGQFILEDSLVEANTQGSEDGIGINITAEQLTLNDGRLVSDTYGDGYGGDIKIKTTGLVELRGKNISQNEQSFSQRELISTSTYGSGNGGDIQIQTEQLNVTEGRYIDSFSFGSGDGGDIQISVAESLTLSGNGPEEISVIGTQAIDSGDAGDVLIQATDIFLENFALIASYSFGTGYSGNIILDARQLSLVDGAQIGSTTFGFGQGGNVLVDVKENVIISGRNTEGFRSGIFTSTDPFFNPFFDGSTIETSSIGNAGDIILQTDQLIMRGGGLLKTSTFGPGLTGDIEITARSLNLSGGSVILTTSQPPYDEYKGVLGGGAGGSIDLNIKEASRMTGDSFVGSLMGTSGSGISINLNEIYLIGSNNSFEVTRKVNEINFKYQWIMLDNSEIKIQGKSDKIDLFRGIKIVEPLSLSTTITPLNAEDQFFGNQCANMTRDELSSFQIIIRDTFPESPLDLKTHFLFD